MADHIHKIWHLKGTNSEPDGSTFRCEMSIICCLTQFILFTNFIMGFLHAAYKQIAK